MKKIKIEKHWVQTIASGLMLIGVTTLIFLYTSGYRLTKDQRPGDLGLKRTGLISAKSIPKSAKVYVNDVLVTTTDDTISSLDPGEYRLKILLDGYVPWEKTVEVFPELVTDITAVLVSETPKLEPLTRTGARAPVISQSLSKLAYFSKDPENPGLWVIPLKGTLNILADPYIVIEDAVSTKYSDGVNIEWAPNEEQILLEGSTGVFYLVDLNRKTTESTTAPELIRETWRALDEAEKLKFLATITIPEEMKKVSLSALSTWAPDKKKFLYTTEDEEHIYYKVYNMEKPLPVGEKVDTLVFSRRKDEVQPKISWYADSFHLILSEGNIEQDKRGLVSLIRIDGTNRTEVYSNTMYSDILYSNPAGDKLIFLTSFKSGEQTDLYTIGIR